VADRFDVVVIGSGPGGYVGAIRAAQLGMKVAVVEADLAGGVCLNWGCIPSKALLTGAELVETLRQKGETFGVRAGSLELDYGKVIDHSRACADRLRKGVEGLLKKNQIEFIHGRGRLAGKTSVEVEGDAPRSLEAAHVVVATGSGELVPKGLEVDGKSILTSREALESKRVPEKLVIIGAGAVGVEFAYVYASYGAQVTVLEMADQMLPGADADVAQALQREFRRKKIDVQLGTRFERMKKANGGVRIDVTRGEESAEIDADQVLVAIGRSPHTSGLGLEELGVELDRRGFVPVDEKLRKLAPTNACNRMGSVGMKASASAPAFCRVASPMSTNASPDDETLSGTLACTLTRAIPHSDASRLSGRVVSVVESVRGMLSPAVSNVASPSTYLCAHCETGRITLSVSIFL